MKDPEQTFRLVFENAPDGMLLADAESREFRMANDSICHMLGYSRQELLRLKVEDIHRTEDLPQVMSEFRRLVRGEGAIATDVPVMRKDGSIFYADISSSETNFGGRSHLLGIFRDVSDRKKAEESLKKSQSLIRESESKYRTLVTNIPDVIWTSDSKGNSTFISPNVASIYGYTPQEIYEHGHDLWLSRVHPDDLERSERAYRDLFEKNVPFDVEYRIRTKDGRWIWLHDRSISTYEKDGVRYSDGIFSDITERRKIVQALRQSEENYRTLVESAGESIASVNEEGVFLFMNTIAAEQLGGKPQDYIGKTMWDLFPGEIADSQMGSIRHVIKTRRGINVIVPTEVRGQMRWHNTTVEPLTLGDSGKADSVLIIARDIHEMKQAQDELTLYREKMAHTHRLASLGTLSATVAHELTQPLTVVRLSLDNLMDDLKSSSSPAAFIRRVDECLNETSHITSIIDRFRTFARKSSKSDVAEVNLKTIAENITQLLGESARRARIALRVSDMDGLPPVRVNERDLEQLFFALVQNAVQAADGRKSRQLLISGSATDNHVEVRFADNCGGIAPEHLDAVMEPFFTTKPPGQGTGLGLCIVQQIASRAGGSIRIESDYGEGATFIVTLPANVRSRP